MSNDLSNNQDHPASEHNDNDDGNDGEIDQTYQGLRNHNALHSQVQPLVRVNRLRPSTINFLNIIPQITCPYRSVGWQQIYFPRHVSNQMTQYAPPENAPLILNPVQRPTEDQSSKDATKSESTLSNEEQAASANDSGNSRSDINQEYLEYFIRIGNFLHDIVFSISNHINGSTENSSLRNETRSETTPANGESRDSNNNLVIWQTAGELPEYNNIRRNRCCICDNLISDQVQSLCHICVAYCLAYIRNILPSFYRAALSTGNSSSRNDNNVEANRSNYGTAVSCINLNLGRPRHLELNYEYNSGGRRRRIDIRTLMNMRNLRAYMVRQIERLNSQRLGRVNRADLQLMPSNGLPPVNELRRQMDNMVDARNARNQCDHANNYERHMKVIELKQLDDDAKDEICSICQENYKENEDSARLPCNHFFHRACIIIWYTDKVTCPLCRGKYS